MQTRVGYTPLMSVIARLKLPLACLVVSIGLTACGGGSATGDSANRLENKAPETTAPQPDTETPSDDDSQTDAPSPIETDDGTDDHLAGGDDDSDDSSDRSEDDGSTAEEGSTVEEDGATPEEDPDSSSPEQNLSEVSGLVRLEWEAPQSRENGEYLELYEIGGYELRYRKAGDSEYEVIPVEDGTTESHEIDQLSGEYEFSIAAYDTNGLYSEFVSLSPVPTN